MSEELRAYYATRSANLVGVGHRADVPVDSPTLAPHYVGGEHNAAACTLDGCDSGEAVFAAGLCASCIHALSDAATFEGA